MRNGQRVAVLTQKLSEDVKCGEKEVAALVVIDQANAWCSSGNTKIVQIFVQQASFKLCIFVFKSIDFYWCR